MFRSGVATLCVAVFLAVFDFGSCTRCYQCNSESDKTCGDPFYATSKIPADCSLTSSTEYNRLYLGSILPGQLLIGNHGLSRSCHKIVMKTGTVVRTCLDVDPADVNKTCRAFNNNVKHCSICDKDLCNGASGLAVSFPLAILAVVASYLLYLQ